MKNELTPFSNGLVQDVSLAVETQRQLINNVNMQLVDTERKLNGIAYFIKTLPGMDATDEFNQINPNVYKNILFPPYEVKLDGAVLKPNMRIYGHKWLSRIQVDSGKQGFTWSSQIRQVEITDLTFKGLGEAISSVGDDYPYFHTAFIHDCTFYTQMKEGIRGNFILSKFENLMFGYFGEVNTNIPSRHIYIRGNTDGNYSNFNEISHCVFINSAVNEAVRIESTLKTVLRQCDFEQNRGSRPLTLAGTNHVTVDSCWFEQNTGKEIAILNNNPINEIGNKVVLFDNCLFGNQKPEVQYLVRSGTSSFQTMRFTGNNAVGTGFTGIEIVNAYHERVRPFHNNYLLGYTGQFTDRNAVPYNIPKVSTKGFSPNVWFKDWSVSNPQGWNRLKFASVVTGEAVGYFSPGVKLTATTGVNLFYIKLPVNYFKGKEVRIQGLAFQGSVSYGDACYLAYNTTEETPANMTTENKNNFNSITPIEKFLDFTVPSDAKYLNVGFKMPVAGDVTILAFDVWILENPDSYVPTFSI